jgi:hypothetical protein
LELDEACDAFLRSAVGDEENDNIVVEYVQSAVDEDGNDNEDDDEGDDDDDADPLRVKFEEQGCYDLQFCNFLQLAYYMQRPGYYPPQICSWYLFLFSENRLVSKQTAQLGSTISFIPWPLPTLSAVRQ